MDRELLAELSRGLLGQQVTGSFLGHLDDPDRPISVEEILHGDVTTRLAAHLSAGRDDLLDASKTLLLSSLLRHKPSSEASKPIATYIAALGGERGPALWEEIRSIAPAWAENSGPSLKET